MFSKLLRATPILLLALGAGCTAAPTTSTGAISSSAVGQDVSQDNVVSTNVMASTISVPAAVALRSQRLANRGELANRGKRFDKAFYDASARRNAAKIAELTQAFLNLGPGVDPEEAARAAKVVYTYVDQLVVEYEITAGPLAHNTAVNFGTKPRGLCWHWAHDIDDRLQLERFRTLQIHRAIANYDNLRLEHSTTMLGRRGDPMSEAIVLDPWRKGGELTWEIARKDTRYNWTERDIVFAYKRRMKESRGDQDSGLFAEDAGR